MFKRLLSVIALGACLAAPAVAVSTAPAEAATVAVRDARDHRGDWRNNARPGRDWHRGGPRRDWHRYDRRPYSWHRRHQRPAWHWCYDRWGRAFACR